MREALGVTGWGMAGDQALTKDSLHIYHIADQMNPVRRGALVNPT
jgi:hypothetical protein